MIVLRNCTLIPELTEETERKQADILVNGEYIWKIAEPGSWTGEGYQEIDMRNKTVMPGLIDMHVHLFMGKTYTGDPVPTACSRAFDCLKYAQFLLDIGITTVRDVGDDENYPTIALRDAIEAGELTGPRLKCSGMTMIPPERGIDSMLFMCGIFSGPDELRKKIRCNFMKGADFVKLYGTGSMISPGSTPGKRIMEIDEIREAVAMAERKGTYCACHCHGTEAIDVMVDCGVRTIEHASLISEGTLKKLDGKRTAGIVPTVSVTSEEVLRSDGCDDTVLARFAEMRERIYQCLGKAKKYDILIGWGTDMSLDSYRKDPQIEFKIRKQYLGYDNLEILKQATIYSAELMGMSEQIGTVKEGKFADLIAVEGDPVKDITVMYCSPAHVMKGGQMIR